MDYSDREVNDYNTCSFCHEEFKETSRKKKYCSPSCGFKDKLANEYHCPICNKVTYDIGKDPYCSKEHRKQGVNEYNTQRECRVCGSIFHGTQFDYTCSDYCESKDDIM